MGYLDNFQFIDAPLKEFPTGEILNRNSAISSLSSWALGLTPYINNKTALVKYLGDPIHNANEKTPVGCPFTFYTSNDVARDFSIGAAGLIGGIAPLITNSNGKPKTIEETISPYIASEPIYYYKYKKLKDFIPNYNDVGRIIRTYPVLGYGEFSNSYYPQTNRFAANMANNLIRISYINSSSPVVDVTFLDELDKNEIGEWIVITGFTMYDKINENYPRVNIPFVFPSLFYTANSTFYIGSWALADPNKFTRQFRTGLTMSIPFNPIYDGTFSNLYNTPYSWGWQSYNNVFGNIIGDIYLGRYWYSGTNFQGLESPMGEEQGIVKSYGYRNVMTVRGWGSANPKTNIYNSSFYLSGKGNQYFVTDEGLTKDSSDTGSVWIFNTPTLIFKSQNDFEKLCKDFGFIATSNLNDALNTPVDFFPDNDGGNVPDGGASTGFPTNNTGSIPNFPDNTSDGIDQRPPNVSALSSAGVYAMNVSQSKGFLNWLMTDDFTQNISNLFNDKLSAVGDLKILPFDIAAHDPSHSMASETITVGNVTGQVGNYRLTDGYNTWVSGGEYHYTAYYGDFNDYNRCSYSLYIPHSGIVELNAGDVVNKTLKLMYAVDLTSGNATAVIYSNGVIIKTASAVMGVSVPITSTNNNQRQLNNALTALSIGNNVLGGVVSSVATGNAMPAVNAIQSGIFQGINNSMTNPLVTQHSGSFGNGTGLSLPQTAFLIITRQIIAMPTDYKSTVGIPTTYRGKISDFVGSGFVSVSADKIDIPCTQTEREEILSALARGIYL